MQLGALGDACRWREKNSRVGREGIWIHGGWRNDSGVRRGIFPVGLGDLLEAHCCLWMGVASARCCGVGGVFPGVCKSARLYSLIL